LRLKVNTQGLIVLTKKKLAIAAVKAYHLLKVKIKEK